MLRGKMLSRVSRWLWFAFTRFSFLCEINGWLVNWIFGLDLRFIWFGLATLLLHKSATPSYMPSFSQSVGSPTNNDYCCC